MVGRENMRSGLLEGLESIALDWQDWGRQRETSVRLVGLQTEIRTQDIPNANQEYCPIYCDIL